MVTLQIKSERMADIITVIQAEIDKNPDGFINIDFTSVDKDSFEPSFSWTPELKIPLLREEKKRIKEVDQNKN